MKLRNSLSVAVATAFVLAGPAFAGVIVQSQAFTAGAAPLPYAKNAADTVGTTSTTYSQYTTSESNFGATGISQSFTAATSGLLANIQFVDRQNGNTNTTLTFKLYEVLTGDTTDIGSSSGNFTVSPAVAPAGQVQVGPNLLTTTSVTGVNANLNAVINLVFSGTDAVPLVAGTRYIFELLPSPTFNIALSNTAAGNYTGGQGYRARAPLNGNANIDFALGVGVVVPEPVSIGTVAVAAVGLLGRRRRA